MLSLAYLFWALIGAVTFATITAINVTISRKDFVGPLIALVPGAIVGYAIGFLAMPTTSLFNGWSVSWYIFVLILAGFWGFLHKMATGSTGEGEGFLPLLIGCVAFLLFGIVSFATTFGGFHADGYAALIAPRLEARERTLPLVDQSQARLVTSQLAVKRAAELISTSDENALGSRVSVGEPWGNEVNGKLVWAAALEHSGFWRWLSFHSTPGYIIVSQSNESEARLVDNQTMKFLTSGWWGENVYRHLYENGYSSYEFAEAVLQLDDDGKPFWLMTLLQPQVGFGGHMPVRWVMLDAADGTIYDFATTEQLPAWVDRAFPQQLLADRFDDWACFSQGWYACMFSGENVISTTPGVGVTMDPAGDLVYYSGTQFQNAEGNGATSGMFIANARSGDIAYYRRAGITENLARDVITQAWANYGYTAADPIPLVLGDGEAYFSIVLDESGSRKGFGVVSMQNRNIFGVGDSIQSAVTAFNVSLRRSNQDAALDAGQIVDGQAFYGFVRTWTPFVSNGKTVFYVSLDGDGNRIFEIGQEKIGEIVATQVGDPVRIDAVDVSANLVYAVGFDNLRLGFEGMGPNNLDDRAQELILSVEPIAPIVQQEPLL